MGWGNGRIWVWGWDEPNGQGCTGRGDRDTPQAGVGTEDTPWPGVDTRGWPGDDERCGAGTASCSAVPSSVPLAGVTPNTSSNPTSSPNPHPPSPGVGKSRPGEPRRPHSATFVPLCHHHKHVRAVSFPFSPLCHPWPLHGNISQRRDPRAGLAGTGQGEIASSCAVEV